MLYTCTRDQVHVSVCCRKWPTCETLLATTFQPLDTPARPFVSRQSNAARCTPALDRSVWPPEPDESSTGPKHIAVWFLCFPQALRPTFCICVCCPFQYLPCTWCVQVLRSPEEAFAAAMQSWRERCEKCVCLKGDYFEKWLHFQLPVVSSFLNKLGDLELERPTSHDVRPSLNCRTHERTFFTFITPSPCLTQLSMNFDWFHATQVEELENHALFFECKHCHFSIKNTTKTQPRHKHSTGNTVLPLGLTQPKEQPRLLQQLSRFNLLPFPRKKN